MNRDEVEEGQGHSALSTGQRTEQGHVNTENNNTSWITSFTNDNNNGPRNPSEDFWTFAKTFAFMAVVATAYCIIAEIIEAIYRGPKLDMGLIKHHRPIKWKRFP